MTTNSKFENEEQFISFLIKNYDLSPGRYDIIKRVCKYLEIDDKIVDSDFEGIKVIFQGYISKRIDDLNGDGLNGGSLTGLRSRGIIDGDDQLTVKGFQVIKLVSRHLTYL